MMNIFVKKLLYQPKISDSGKKLIFTAIYMLLILYYLWVIPAVYFLNLPWEWLRITLTILFALTVPILIALSKKNKQYLWGAAGVCLFFGTWFSMIPPSNNRNWTTDVAKLPIVRFNGDIVTIKNIRHFTYRTEHDYIPSYYDATYDLNQLTTADYILSYWDGNTLVAHSMCSFGFKDGRHICVSVETRREKNEPQSGFRGLYNQYELIYILADESDLLLLRTNYRKEKVYLYPLRVKTPETLKKVFLKILKEVVKLEKKPIFYNTLRDNCFTTLLKDVREVTGHKPPWDYRTLANGLSDEMGYERGWFYTDNLSFEDFKKKHYINQYVENDPDPQKNFSEKIRQQNTIRQK